MEFSFDMNAAKKAGVSNRISESGGYIGTVNKAVVYSGKEPSQSKTLVLSFTGDNGQSANFMRINFIGRDGQPISNGNGRGWRVFNSLMFAANTQKMQTRQRPDDKGGMEDYLPALEGKRLGLVLQRVNFNDERDGHRTYRMEPQVAYRADGRTYNEYVSQATEATEIARMVENLRDYDESPANPSTGGGWGGETTGGGQPGGFGGGQQGGFGGGQRSASQNTDPNAVPYSRTQQYNDSRAQQQQNGPDFDDDIPF